MKTCYLSAIKQIEIKDVDVPVPQKGEIVVQVKSALTCGTTLKTYLRGHPSLKFPARFGHECSGIIHQSGEGVVDFNCGDRVVFLHSYPCQTCFYCQNGKTNLCESFFKNLNLGAFAEYILVPESIVKLYCFKVPEHVSFRRAAFLQSLSCVVHALRKCQFKQGDGCLIIGTGSFAILLYLVSQKMGYDPVIIGRNPVKVEQLKKQGFHCILKVQELQDQNFLSNVIEAVGSKEAWESAVKWVNPGGKVLFYGGLSKDVLWNMDHHKLHYKELTLLGAFHYVREDVLMAKDLLFDSINPDFLIKAVYSLNELELALQQMNDGEGMKYEIHP